MPCAVALGPVGPVLPYIVDVEDAGEMGTKKEDTATTTSGNVAGLSFTNPLACNTCFAREDMKRLPLATLHGVI